MEAFVVVVVVAFAISMLLERIERLIVAFNSSKHERKRRK